MKTNPRFLGLCAAGLLTLASAQTNLSAAVVFSDDFSDNSVTNPTYSLAPGVQWQVISGSFQANGDPTTPANYLPTAGQLNFGPDDGTSIGVNFAGSLGVIPSSAFSITFDLRDSNATNGFFGFRTRLYDSSSGIYQSINITPNTGFYGTSGYAIFQIYGPGNDDYFVNPGTAGAAFPATSDFQSIQITFDPTSGLTNLYVNSVMVNQFLNAFPDTFNSIDRVEFFTQTPGLSWFVDNVSIDTAMVPEPGQIGLLGLAALVIGGVALRRRQNNRVA